MYENFTEIMMCLFFLTDKLKHMLFISSHISRETSMIRSKNVMEAIIVLRRGTVMFNDIVAIIILL